jgi:hypothetical protein
VIDEAYRLAKGGVPTIPNFITAYNSFMTKPMHGTAFDTEVARISTFHAHSIQKRRCEMTSTGLLSARRRQGRADCVLPPSAAAPIDGKKKDDDEGMDGKHVDEQVTPLAPPPSPVLAASTAPVMASSAPPPTVMSAQQATDLELRISHEACRLANGGRPAMADFFKAYQSMMTEAARGIDVDKIVARLSNKPLSSVQAMRSAMGLDGRLPVERRGLHQYILPPGAVPAASSSEEQTQNKDDDTETEDDNDERPPMSLALKDRLHKRTKELADARVHNRRAGHNGRIGCAYYALAYVESLKWMQDNYDVVHYVSELSDYSEGAVSAALADLENDQIINTRTMPVDDGDLVTFVLPLDKPLPIAAASASV